MVLPTRRLQDAMFDPKRYYIRPLPVKKLKNSIQQNIINELISVSSSANTSNPYLSAPCPQQQNTHVSAHTQQQQQQNHEQQQLELQQLEALTQLTKLQESLATRTNPDEPQPQPLSIAAAAVAAAPKSATPPPVSVVNTAAQSLDINSSNTRTYTFAQVQTSPSPSQPIYNEPALPPQSVSKEITMTAPAPSNPTAAAVTTAVVQEDDSDEESMWDLRYAELKAFYSEYGHSQVPENFRINQKLAKWVTRQREQNDFWEKQLKEKVEPWFTSRRRALLRKLDFRWSLEGQPYTPSDVLCGRGSGTYKHPGNKVFRSMVDRYQFAYLQAQKYEKLSISKWVVYEIQQRGGRFMKQVGKDKDHWEEITQNEAVSKTSQLLRDARPKDRNSKAAVALMQAAANFSMPRKWSVPPMLTAPAPIVPVVFASAATSSSSDSQQQHLVPANLTQEKAIQEQQRCNINEIEEKQDGESEEQADDESSSSTTSSTSKKEQEEDDEK